MTATEPTQLGKPRTKALSFAEHDALGADLQAVRDRLGSLACELGEAYGSTRKPAGAAGQAQVAVDRLRCVMDSRLANDHPSRFDPRVYYRASGTPAKTTEQALDSIASELIGRRDELVELVESSAPTIERRRIEHAVNLLSAAVSLMLTAADGEPLRAKGDRR